jgi:hypothetical protein
MQAGLMRPATLECSMKWKAASRLVRAALATITAALMVPAQAGPHSVAVTVKVTMVSTSGVCGVLTGTPAVGVTCGHGAQTLIGGGAGAAGVLLQQVGMIQGVGIVAEPLQLYSDGTKISSWRIVKLDNADYVELTIAW